MKLIIGLGNPGAEYEKTRHNVGWRIVDTFAKQQEASDWKSSDKANADITDLQIDGEKILLAKPKTFMNLSGGPISKLVQYFKLDPQQDILIVFDDKDLMFGTLRHRIEGSSGGHNGIKSTIAALGTESFHRLKVGVGHEEQKLPTKAFILQKFTKEEEEQLPKIVQEAVENIQSWLQENEENA